MKKLELWNEVEKTDPKYTKEFNRGGGFKGTAINATYLARKATAAFGPMGIGWGVDIEDESIMDGAPLAEGVVEKIHKVRVRLWYVLDDKRGEVVQFGQTTFVGKNRHGFFTDEEAPKKSLTDAMNKCLSLLGFSADIHLGLFDDNKYIETRRSEVRKEERLADVLERISTADAETLEKAQEWVKTNVKAKAELAKTKAAIATRREQLEKEAKPKKKAEPGSDIDPVLNRIKKADSDGLIKAQKWVEANVANSASKVKALEAIKARELELDTQAQAQG